MEQKGWDVFRVIPPEQDSRYFFKLFGRLYLIQNNFMPEEPSAILERKIFFSKTYRSLKTL